MASQDQRQRRKHSPHQKHDPEQHPDRILTLPGPLNRVAVFGGIYSNHLALAAAIRDARAREVDAMLCLGDLGGFGPHPDRVFPLLRDHGVITMAGNYDLSIGHGRDDCGCGYTDPRDNRYAQISYDYTFANTSKENRAWMRELPTGLRFRLGGTTVRACHGSPRRTNEFLWESATPDGLLARLLDDAGADLLLATHTGLKWSRRLADGRGFINVGVLGRPENDGTPRVWYTLLEAGPGASAGSAGQTYRETFLPVAYDHDRLAGEMQAENLPPEFGETIRTGWWTTCLEILPARERLAGRF